MKLWSPYHISEMGEAGQFIFSIQIAWSWRVSAYAWYSTSKSGMFMVTWPLYFGK